MLSMLNTLLEIAGGSGNDVVQAPGNTVAPSFTGTPKVGQLLLGNQGTWTNSPTSYSYQWQRNGVNISGATSLNYTPVDADITSTLRLHVDATNAAGTTGANSSSSASVFSATVTGQGKSCVLGIGDSIMSGTSPTVTITPAATLYKYDIATGNDLEITTQSVSNGGNFNSLWPKHAVAYKNHTGFSTVIHNAGSPGAEFAVNGDTNNWSTSGVLYTPAVNNAKAMLIAHGLDKLRKILCNCGVNDATQTEANLPIATVLTAIDSLISRLKTDFPDTEIHFILPGRTASSGNSDRLEAIRHYLINLSETDSLVVIAGSIAGFGVDAVGLISGDNLHPTDAGYDQIGLMSFEAEKYSVQHKVSRRILSCAYTQMNSSDAAAIISFVNSRATAGDIWNIDALYSFVTATKQDCIFGLMGAEVLGVVASTSNFDFSANAHITSAVTGSKYAQDVTLRLANNKGSQNDFFFGVMTGVNSTAEGTNGTIVGGTDGTSFCTITQNTSSNVRYSVNSSTTVIATGETKIADNTTYFATTMSGTAALWKQGVKIHEGTLDTNAVPARGLNVGANNNAGSPQNIMNSQIKFLIRGKASGTNFATLHSDLVTLINALSAA